MACRYPLPGADFTFFWKIKNFSLWNELRLKKMKSPTFYADSLYGTRWKLALKRDQDNQSYDLLLQRAKIDDGPEELTFNLSVGVLNQNDFLIKCDEKNIKVGRNIYCKVFAILNQSEIKSASSISSDNLLIIRCSLMESSNQVPQTYKSTTEVDMKKVSFAWNVDVTDEFQIKSVNAVSLLNEAPPLYIQLNMDINDDSNSLHFTFNGQEIYDRNLQMALNCKITFLRDDLEENPSIEFRHAFESEKDIVWHFPQTFEVRNSNTKFPISLKFYFDLEFSYGNYTSKIEETAYIQGETFSQFQSCLTAKDFLPMYKNGRFFDIKIRLTDAKGGLFFAHKDVLCLRSPVFEKMILKAKDVNEIEVEGVDAATMSKLLTFLYSSMSLEMLQSYFYDLEGDNWKNFTKLYASADKYEIAKLKNLCSAFLASKINSENVMECIKIARYYKDDSLKTATHNYFTAYASEIINSNYFKKLLVIS